MMKPPKRRSPCRSWRFTPRSPAISDRARQSIRHATIILEAQGHGVLRLMDCNKM